MVLNYVCENLVTYLLAHSSVRLVFHEALVHTTLSCPDGLAELLPVLTTGKEERTVEVEIARLKFRQSVNVREYFVKPLVCRFKSDSSGNYQPTVKAATHLKICFWQEGLS